MENTRNYKTTEKQRLYAKAYAAVNREKRKANDADRRLSDPEFAKRQSDYGKKWRTENAAHVKSHDRQTYLKEKASGKYRNDHLLRKYGIDLDQYYAMLALQEGGCAICGSGPSGKSKDWLHVDHDHTTDQIRQLLCGECNTALGKFRDSSELLDKAAAYLRKHGK